jgi:hypothetical protein
MSNARNLANLLGTDTQIQTADIADDAVTIGKLNDNATQLFGFRNRIINGDMRIDQRNAGAAVTASSSFPVDRFVMSNTTNGSFSAQRDTSAPAGFVNSLKVTTTTADTSLTGTQTLIIQQRIEGTNTSDFSWGTANAQTVTLSFWVRSSLTGTFGGSLRNAEVSRSYPFAYSISVADTWEYKTIIIDGDTSGTWFTTTDLGVRVQFSLGSGPDVSGTAGAWAGSSLLSVTGATSVVGTNGATFYITGVQLEAGSVATPFERRPYGTELALCQRYFEAGSALMLAQRIDTGSLYFSNYWRHPFKVTKRASPTVSQTMISGSTFGFSATDESLLAAGYVYNSATGNTQISATWTASAEL